MKIIVLFPHKKPQGENLRKQWLSTYLKDAYALRKKDVLDVKAKPLVYTRPGGEYFYRVYFYHATATAVAAPN